MITRPKVSVYLIAYNQAQFIAKALDSVLTQQANFDYEVVVGDDCSVDGTREIVEDYVRRWPHRIKPCFHQSNVGMMRNAIDTLNCCVGEYVAFLEGDDYWTDPRKLQIQADYLDKNKSCALCHHKVFHIAWPQNAIIREYPPPRYRVEKPRIGDLAKFNYIQTCSLMFRRKLLPHFDDEFEQLQLGDWPLCILLSQKGWVGYLDIPMAHYRVHANNSWNRRPADYKIRAMEKMCWYILDRVDKTSKENWKETILALEFKDIALSVKAMQPAKLIRCLRKFINHSCEFRKPFWVLNRLWPYYRANYIRG